MTESTKYSDLKTMNGPLRDARRKVINHFKQYYTGDTKATSEEGLKYITVNVPKFDDVVYTILMNGDICKIKIKDFTINTSGFIIEYESENFQITSYYDKYGDGVYVTFNGHKYTNMLYDVL